MGLRQVWQCDRCGAEKIRKGREIEDKPPSDWHVIPVPSDSSIDTRLLCPDCMTTLRDAFIGRREAS